MPNCTYRRDLMISIFIFSRHRVLHCAIAIPSQVQVHKMEIVHICRLKSGKVVDLRECTRRKKASILFTSRSRFPIISTIIIFPYTHIQAQTHIYTHIHTHTYACIHTYIHVHAHAPSQHTNLHFTKKRPEH